MRLRWLALLLPAALLIGCSPYTLNPRGKSDINSIAIERFENDTDQYELTDRMTDVVIDAFLADGNLKVLPRDNADAILTGTLRSYSRTPSDYDENDEVISYSVTMTFDIALRKHGQDSDMWQELMTQEGIYLVASQTEQDAQDEAISLLVQDIINKTTKSW
jgi:hypothetical protein